ncbi:SsgA family sporulation/cell division regulator [Streptomyces humi]|uniref:SsgA family sporulation/cell division regulator n=1 Tax=Streptomyces humi TaxID=1428620 RepID=UPI000628934D|nr:SsgA family sporulation/cell division regulator [Streptomyces humi]
MPDHVIDQLLHMELVLPSGERLAVPTLLRYSAKDPFAAVLDFHTGTDHQVRWVLDRDMLAEGLRRPTGRGDVRLRPTGTGPRTELSLILSSPHGRAQLLAPLRVVAQWLGRTYELVPSGQEAEGLDVDAELSRLLHGAA